MKAKLQTQLGFFLFAAKCHVQMHIRTVRQIGIWRGCPRRQCVQGAVRFVTALTRSVSFLRNSSTNWNLSNSFAPHRSLPLMREVDSPHGEDGGRDNYPSGKNQRFLPASLTRGALGRSRASTTIRQIGIYSYL